MFPSAYNCDRFNGIRTVDLAMENDNQRLRTATIGISYGTRAQCHGRGTEATQSYERQVIAFFLPSRKESPTVLG